MVKLLVPKRFSKRSFGVITSLTTSHAQCSQLVTVTIFFTGMVSYALCETTFFVLSMFTRLLLWSQNSISTYSFRGNIGKASGSSTVFETTHCR